jgi:mono/diheme cytochrome c family protein
VIGKSDSLIWLSKRSMAWNFVVGGVFSNQAPQFNCHRRDWIRAMMHSQARACLLAGALWCATCVSQAADVETQKGAATNGSVADVEVKAGPGSSLYAAGCSSCHYRGKGKPDFEPAWTIGSTLGFKGPFGADDPDEVIRTILFGVPEFWSSGMQMPAFGHAMTDADVAALVAYLRSANSKQPPWTDLPSKVSSIRSQAAKP